jgi:hypothetical protein
MIAINQKQRTSVLMAVQTPACQLSQGIAAISDFAAWNEFIEQRFAHPLP